MKSSSLLHCLLLFFWEELRIMWEHNLDEEPKNTQRYKIYKRLFQLKISFSSLAFLISHWEFTLRPKNFWHIPVESKNFPVAPLEIIPFWVPVEKEGWSSDPNSGSIYKGNEIMNLKTHLQPHIYCSIIHHSQRNMETT